MANKFDDEDIKIFGQEPVKPTPEPEEPTDSSFETQSVIAMLRREKRFGNIAHAKSAAITLCNGSIKLVQSVENDDRNIKTQCYCVVAFGVISGLERYISNDIILRVLMNSYYEQLQKNSPEFYDSLNNLTAMSFYYLASHRPEKLVEQVCTTFASLCKHTDEPEFIELGRQLFCNAVKLAKTAALEENLLK